MCYDRYPREIGAQIIFHNHWLSICSIRPTEESGAGFLKLSKGFFWLVLSCPFVTLGTLTTVWRNQPLSGLQQTSINPEWTSTSFRVSAGTTAWGPIHTGLTCWCEWECSHYTQATSKHWCLSLCARVWCGLDLKPHSASQPCAPIESHLNNKTSLSFTLWIVRVGLYWERKPFGGWPLPSNVPPLHTWTKREL